jgi:pSer/pThr/pTyr-binding forkhead associated (FHA) protein
MPAMLIARTEGPDLPLDRPVLLVGRHAECDLQLQSNKVSRRHCIIAYVNNQMMIRDLGSTNGVRINGDRVAEGRLHDGDEVSIGNFRYEVRATIPPRTRPISEDERIEHAEEPIPLNDNPSADVPVAKKAPKF